MERKNIYKRRGDVFKRIAKEWIERFIGLSEEERDKGILNMAYYIKTYVMFNYYRGIKGDENAFCIAFTNKCPNFHLSKIFELYGFSTENFHFPKQDMESIIYFENEKVKSVNNFPDLQEILYIYEN